MQISGLLGLQSVLFNSNYLEPIVTTTVKTNEYRPVVIWHGLGDNYNASGIHKVQELVSDLYPGIFTYSIYIDEDPSVDQQRSLFGDANKQVDQVCQQFQEIPELASAESIDAIGFSQGGVLLRGLIERCPGVRVNNFITFGSPHMGVMEMPLCKNDKDWICKRRNQFLKRQVWYDNVQKAILPAQYFRDPFNLDEYLEHSYFLADINNERTTKNSTYSNRFANINKLLLVTFTKDTTVVPKESAMFCDVDANSKQTVPFDQTELYLKDYIG
ncbi:uncharacterized protein LODBEIA_P24850 [Lodderomyces beijingensis]|uniref:Palmitoyl-protein thioesterase 1 n=1 Tax=Lodderomyces beijingensis TaxID=1775926 RepID=A0ABP0ZJF1_9ASCO